MHDCAAIEMHKRACPRTRQVRKQGNGAGGQCSRSKVHAHSQLGLNGTKTTRNHMARLLPLLMTRFRAASQVATSFCTYRVVHWHAPPACHCCGDSGAARSTDARSTQSLLPCRGHAPACTLLAGPLLLRQTRGASISPLCSASPPSRRACRRSACRRCGRAACCAGALARPSVPGRHTAAAQPAELAEDCQTGTGRRVM